MDPRKGCDRTAELECFRQEWQHEINSRSVEASGASTSSNEGTEKTQNEPNPTITEGSVTTETPPEAVTCRTELRQSNDCGPSTSKRVEITTTVEESVTTEKPPGTNTRQTERRRLNDGASSTMKQVETLEDVINLSLTTLSELGRANFTTGVHFCPPHFVDHTFFTEEMAHAYRQTNTGPLRDYQGRVWEELTYHALMENLPHLPKSSSFACMWVFYGMYFANNCIVRDLVEKETEIDFLVACLTKSGNIRLIPVEVKRCSRTQPVIQWRKAQRQCKSNAKVLSNLINLMFPVNLSAAEIEQMVRPVIFMCHNESSEHSSYRSSPLATTFNVCLDQYDQFKYTPENQTPTNFFVWLASLAEEEQPFCHGENNYQKLVCLLTSIISCKPKNSINHMAMNCYSHFTKGGNREFCIKGSAVCPKYIHQIVVNKIDFLKYFSSFAKNPIDQVDPNIFSTYNVNKLERNISKFVRKYLTYVTNEQLLALLSEAKRAVLFGDYGAGKTIILLVRALFVVVRLVDGTLKGRVRVVSTANAIEKDINPKLKSVFGQEILANYLSVESWDNFDRKISSNDHCFLDEFGDAKKIREVQDCLRPHYEEWLFESKPQMIWMVVAAKVDKSKITEHHPKLMEFEFFNLRWQLRNSCAISDFADSIWRSHNQFLYARYPIYGARCRIRTIDSQLLVAASCPPVVIEEVGYWLKQIKNGSILIHNNFDFEQGTSLSDILASRLEEEFHVKFQDLQEGSGIIKIAPLEIQGYIATGNISADTLVGLEFDVVICIETLPFVSFWEVLSRATYGLSFLSAEKLPQLEYLKQWGRYSVLEG